MQVKKESHRIPLPRISAIKAIVETARDGAFIIADTITISFHTGGFTNRKF